MNSYFTNLKEKLMILSLGKNELTTKSLRFSLLRFYKIEFKKNIFKIDRDEYPYTENTKFENLLQRFCRNEKRISNKLLRKDIGLTTKVLLCVKRDKMRKNIKMFKTILHKLTIYNRYIKLQKIKCKT